ncbi:ninjurin-2 isoform X6 [Canis lupus familiaris]|uniref:ninjurin-2 isoform X6 n=1 Tax=Canis lupus familiaris TaxID=9615 RepID=UPI0015F17653|nr:ninjurin-2 isoform X6 [Canis lupus familiaris]XP_038315577.1 ninjurin-2 isoform X6 [Canis lupus familiaris]XP_038432321.1 ninjurin-2 isoform X6 [Canis lupus familiaris]
MLQHTIEDLGLGQSFLICFQVASIIMAQGFEKVKYNFPSSVIQSTTHLASGAQQHPAALLQQLKIVMHTSGPSHSVPDRNVELCQLIFWGSQEKRSP